MPYRYDTLCRAKAKWIEKMAKRRRGEELINSLKQNELITILGKGAIKIRHDLSYFVLAGKKYLLLTKMI